MSTAQFYLAYFGMIAFFVWLGVMRGYGVLPW
jgi:hypothetical protein